MHPKSNLGYTRRNKTKKKHNSMYVGQTTKSIDSEYTSISARYSEKCLKILKITKDSENSEHC